MAGRWSVMIAGGGVAAFETALALRSVAGEQTEVTLLAPDRYLVYRQALPAAVFNRAVVSRFRVDWLAAAIDARVRPVALSACDTEGKTVRTDDGEILPYDALVVACGAQPVEAVSGALPFPHDDQSLRGILQELRNGAISSLAFAVPRRTWPLPAYELAMLAARELTDHGQRDRVELTVVTAEPRPLEMLGATVSARVRSYLNRAEIRLLTGHQPVSFRNGALLLDGDKKIEFHRAIALPQLHGWFFEGLPHDDDGFIPTDEHGRITNVPDVYAAGDGTTQPIKLGGLAAQQADAVADAIAHDIGILDDPQPYHPVVRAMMLTDGEPLYLRVDLGAEADAATITTQPLWWPASKIAGVYLAPFLAAQSRLSEVPTDVVNH